MNWQRFDGVLGAWIFCVALSAVAAEHDTDLATERARMKAEQAQVQSRFAREEAACYQRFAVNDCLQEARARQRAALNDLRRQEIALNDAERKRKGEERIRRLNEKAAVSRPVPAPAAPDGLQQTVPAEPPPASSKSGRTQAKKDQRVAVELAPRPAKVRKAPKPRPESKPPGTPDVSAPPATGAKAPTQAEREQARQERVQRRDKALAERTQPPASPLPVPQ